LDEKLLVTELVKFGITEQEADLFVLLSRVRTGGKEWIAASDIYKATNRDRVRVYQLLQRLLKLGLVEASLSRPKKYSVVSPQTSIRRLLAIHETRLTELSHLEEDVVTDLLHLPAFRIDLEKESPVRKETPGILYLHGLPNVQSELRKMMEGQDLSIVINDESYKHIMSTVGYLKQKPRSARVIVAMDEKPLKRRMRESHFGRLTVASSSEELPTFVLTAAQCALLFYSVKQFKKRTLSESVESASVSDAIVVESKRYVKQMHRMFDQLWGFATNN
jgi:sugar-specific transcriptional regulator TrmB